MELRLHLPFDSEAEVVLDADRNLVRIKPRIYSERGRGAVGYLEVCNDDGRVQHRYMLQVAGRNGTLLVGRRKNPVRSLFDKTTARDSDDFLPKLPPEPGSKSAKASEQK